MYIEAKSGLDLSVAHINTFQMYEYHGTYTLCAYINDERHVLYQTDDVEKLKDYYVRMMVVIKSKEHFMINESIIKSVKIEVK